MEAVGKGVVLVGLDMRVDKGVVLVGLDMRMDKGIVDASETVDNWVVLVGTTSTAPEEVEGAEVADKRGADMGTVVVGLDTGTVDKGTVVDEKDRQTARASKMAV